MAKVSAATTLLLVSVTVLLLASFTSAQFGCKPDCGAGQCCGWHMIKNGTHKDLIQGCYDNAGDKCGDGCPCGAGFSCGSDGVCA